jgi:alkylhydroperoxidase family enzyme
MAWIETISEQDADGRLKRQYEAGIKRAGRVYNIIRIMSQNPETMRTSMGLYMATMLAGSPLSRAQREMLATVVSRTNGCHY